MAQTLIKKGFKRVYALKGGWRQWLIRSANQKKLPTDICERDLDILKAGLRYSEPFIPMTGRQKHRARSSPSFVCENAVLIAKREHLSDNDL
jgi:hypothetical protein